MAMEVDTFTIETGVRVLVYGKHAGVRACACLLACAHNKLRTAVLPFLLYLFAVD